MLKTTPYENTTRTKVVLFTGTPAPCHAQSAGVFVMSKSDELCHAVQEPSRNDDSPSKSSLQRRPATMRDSQYRSCAAQNQFTAYLLAAIRNYKRTYLKKYTDRLVGLRLLKQLTLDIRQDRDGTTPMPLTVCAVCHRQATRKTAMLRADDSAIKHLLVQRIPAANAESLLTDGTLSEPRFSAVHHLFPRGEYTGLISRLRGIFQCAEERLALLWLLVLRRRRQRSRIDPAGDQCRIHGIIKRIVEGKHRWKLTI